MIRALASVELEPHKFFRRDIDDKHFNIWGKFWVNLILEHVKQKVNETKG